MTATDAPIASSSEDLLGRVAFADEIVDLATTTPSAWAPRIGVYGSWGSGKTSVLNIVSERLRASLHVVARFNPWGFRAVDEMFSALADAVLDAIEEQGNEIKKQNRRASKAAKLLEKNARSAGATTIAYASGILRRVFEKKKITQLSEALGELDETARCVVLVDDIDRADPSLLPPLLFALHEVLSSVPIVFVIALDPVVVGAALKTHHPGFGDGLAFLEKMIQFPRWLPEVTDDDRWRLVSVDAERYLPLIDRDALRQEFEIFPKNPREARTLLRSLWGVNSQAKRYHPGQLSWNLILRLAAARSRFRKLIDGLLGDEHLLNRLIAAQLSRQDRSREATPLAPEVATALEKRGIDTARLPEVAELIGSQRRLAWDGESSIRHARIVEQPPSITLLEAEQIFDEVLTQPVSGATTERVRRAVASHAQSVRRSIDEVSDEALTLVLHMHNDLLGHSADGLYEHGTVGHAEAAQRLVALVQAVLRVQTVEVSAEQFQRVLFAFMRWMHFDTLPAYRALHAREAEVLTTLCDSTQDPGAYLEVLAPWERDAHDHDRKSGALWLALQNRLEIAVDRHLDRILQRVDGVNGMLREQRSAERWCLLRMAAWSQARIERLRDLEDGAASSNSLDLLRLLANLGGDARPNRYGVSDLSLDEMAKSRELTGALWEALTRRPINLRFFSSVERIRQSIENARGAPLPTPPWWERIKGTRDAAHSAAEDESRSVD